MYGYDLSSRSAMLYCGWYSLIRFASRISACASLGTTIVSSPPTDSISARVLMLSAWSAVT